MNSQNWQLAHDGHAYNQCINKRYDSCNQTDVVLIQADKKGWCYAPKYRELSLGIYYAHKIWGLFLEKTMTPKFWSVLFTNFLCPRNSTVKHQFNSSAFTSISYVLVYCRGGQFCMSSYAQTVIIPLKGLFCCRVPVTFAWKNFSIRIHNWLHLHLRYPEDIARVETGPSWANKCRKTNQMYRIQNAFVQNASAYS